MQFSEYRQYDALGLAHLIKQKHISAVELLDIAIERARAVNPQINALTQIFYERAITQIQQLSGDETFVGVPFAVKNLLCQVEGTATTGGSALLKNEIAMQDCFLTSRLKNAGLVIFAKSNTPEFGLMGITEPAAFGPTRNPWSQRLTPGGSSGGSAAAVAAGIVPCASGGDGGGSIRIPSAYCGLFGLKPSRGRISCGPHHAEVWDGAASQHVISRSVRDSAAMLDVLSQPVSGEPYLPAAPFDLKNSLIPPAGPLKIAYSTKSPLGNSVDPDIHSALQNCVAMLTDLGHEVHQADPAVNGEELAQCYLRMYFAHVGAELAELEVQFGKGKVRNSVEPSTYLLGRLGHKISAAEHVQLKWKWNQFSRSMAKFQQTYDLYLTPTTAMMPAEVGSLLPKGIELLGLKTAGRLGLSGLLLKSGLVEKLARESLHRTPFTQLANLCGLPAMSVPICWSGSGHPIGMQFVASMGQEQLLFSLATQLEEAYPWFDKVPQLG